MFSIRHYCFASLLLFLFSIFSAELHASVISREEIDHFLEKLGGDDGDTHDGEFHIGVLPGPFYTPELGLGLGFAVVGAYRLNPEDSKTQDSSLAVSGFVSTTGAVGANLTSYTFFADDQYRLFIDGVLNHQPTYFWGVGYQAGKENNKQKYTEQAYQVHPRFFIRTFESIYMGLGLDISRLQANSIRDTDYNSITDQPAGRDVRSIGISSSFLYDTRDFAANASKGQYLDLAYSYFSTDIGSDISFQKFKAQYNTYFPLSINEVLAFDIYGDFSSKRTPWNSMAMLGSDSQMRGYYEGRYRDRHALSVQAEYRRQLDWRHGVVAWIGAGTLSEKLKHLGQRDWLPNVGVGYRFEFKPKMNVRLDFGFGQKSSGFYFQVGEAF